MIRCRICGDQEGPWIYVDKMGFVCERCERKRAKYDKKLHYKKKEDKHDL